MQSAISDINLDVSPYPGSPPVIVVKTDLSDPFAMILATNQFFVLLIVLVCHK